MSAMGENPEKSKALLPHKSSDVVREGTEHPDSVRHPSSLQGLLRFAMTVTKPDDSSNLSEIQPMDEERKKFLEDALKSMTVDVVQILQQQIRILQSVNQLKVDSDVTKYEDALTTILDYVDNIDVANDFHKIGGFMILHPCLTCAHPTVRAGGCELLAVLCQNNPYCQRLVLDNNFIPKLLDMVDNDDDIQVVLKALYALGGIVRENEEGFHQLIHYKGLPILLKALKRNNEKFIIKTTFLLTALCRTQPDLKNRLIFLDFVPTLINLISLENSPSDEHVLSLLVTLVEESPTAIAECKNPKYNLKEHLQKYVNNIRNKDECMEEELYCKRLLHILFAGI